MRRRGLTVAVIAAVALLCVGLTSAAAALALRQPDIQHLDAETASKLHADYSPDPRGTHFAPLQPGIVGAAQDDGEKLDATPVARATLQTVDIVRLPTATPAAGPPLAGATEATATAHAGATPGSATPTPGAPTPGAGTATIEATAHAETVTPEPKPTEPPPTETAVPADTPTLPPKPTETPDEKPTDTPEPTRPPTKTSTPRPIDPVKTFTPKPTNTPSTGASTATKTPTNTPQPANTVGPPAGTPSPLPATAVPPTNTPTPVTPTQTLTPTPTSTVTLTPTATATSTPAPTVVPTSTPGTPTNTGFHNCTANAADTGGDGDGYETTPAFACADDGQSAHDTSGLSLLSSCSNNADRHRFFDYGFNIPGSTSIDGITVRLDASGPSIGLNPVICVELSWDGGSSWTAAKMTPALGASEATYLIGGAADTWGRSWGHSEFDDGKLVVRLTDATLAGSKNFSLEYVAVDVAYTP